MIKPLFGAREGGTLVANPRGKRRKRRNGRSGGQSLASLLRGPRSKKRNGKRKFGKKRNGVHSAIAKKRRRNPEVGGINVVDAGLGSAAVIVAGSVGQAIFDRYLSNQIDSPMLRKAAPNLLVVGAAYLAQKKLTGKGKSIAKYALVASIFKLVDDVGGDQIRETTSKMLPGTSGVYTPAFAGNAGTAGAFVDETGGSYVPTGSGGGTSGLFEKANLYGL